MDRIDPNAAMTNVKKLLDEEQNISPSLKTAIEVVLMLVPKMLKEQNITIERLQSMIDGLQHQLNQLLRQQYGKKSERKNKSTRSSSPKAKAKPKNENNNLNGRKKFPEDLPRQKIKYDLPEKEKSCPNCKQPLIRIGTEKSEQLEYIPAQLIVKQHRRAKYGCRYCKEHMAIADMPVQPIDKGAAGPGLLTEVLLDKYQDGLPLYRQEQRWARLGYLLPRSTLCDWVSQCAKLLKPIVDVMHEDLLIRNKLHTDDTTLPVLAKVKTHTGRLWTYIAGGDGKTPIIVYDYTPTRSGKGPKKFLKNYRGYLQADAFSGYDNLYEDGNIIEIGCMAHCRRKFFDIAETLKKPGLAHEALDFIKKLYLVESRVKLYTFKQRKYYRKHFAKPILKQFRFWLNEQQKEVLPKSATGKAIAYALNHWRALNNYLADGILEIDNNRAERAIKPLVIGRKNYLFAGSHQGAENAAIIYSLIETCKENDINTRHYFTDILKRLPTCLNKNIRELLPYCWKPPNN